MKKFLGFRALTGLGLMAIAACNSRSTVGDRVVPVVMTSPSPTVDGGQAADLVADAGLPPMHSPWRDRVVAEMGGASWNTGIRSLALALSRDGTRIAVGGWGPTVAVLDGTSGQLLQRIEVRQTKGVFALAFADGQLLIGGEKVAVVVDVATGAEVARHVSEGQVQTAFAGTDGRTAWFATPSLQSVDLPDGALGCARARPTSAAGQLPDGRIVLASGDSLELVRGCDAAAIATATLPDRVRALAVSDKQTIAITEGTIVRLRTRDLKETGQIQAPAAGDDADELAAVAVAADGTFVVGARSGLLVYNARGQFLRRISVGRPVRGVVLLDGGIAATVDGSARVRRWKISDGGEIVDTSGRGHGDEVIRVAWTPDGRLVSAAVDGSIINMDPETGATTRAVIPSAALALALAGDAKSVYVGARDGRVSQLSLPLLDQRAEVDSGNADGNHNPVTAILDWPPARGVAAGWIDGTICLVGDDLPCRPLARHSLRQVYDLALSPDNTRLAIVGFSTSANALEVYPTSGGPAVIPDTDQNELSRVCWAGSSTVVIGGGRRVARVDISTSKVSELARAAREVISVACSSDGTIAAGDESGAIYRWHADWTKAPPLALAGAASALAFSPDGKYLAAGSSTGAITVWAAK